MSDDGARRAVGAEPRRVDKPWGHELIWAETDRYVGKVIVVRAGRRLSLQRHERKDESVLVTGGRLLLHLEDGTGAIRVHELRAGDHRRVPTGRIHRFEAPSDCDVELVEISTPELDDVIRIEDDYGREGTAGP